MVASGTDTVQTVPAAVGLPGCPAGQQDPFFLR